MLCLNYKSQQTGQRDVSACHHQSVIAPNAIFCGLALKSVFKQADLLFERQSCLH